MNPILNKLFENKPNFDEIPGGVELPYKPIIGVMNEPEIFYENKENSIMLINDAVYRPDCEALIEFFKSHGKFSPVSVQGFNDNSFNGEIGSNRITGFNGEISNDIYLNLKHLLKDKLCDNLTSTDWWQGYGKETATYRPIGFSPMLRFMVYAKGGKHYPHYDAGFIYPDNKYRTLKSFVLYLTTNNSGATRFIKDKQLIDKMPISLRDHSDWNIEPLDFEIDMKFNPVQGTMLIFDHRLCHDVEEYLGTEGERIIIRGDVLYERI